MMVLEIEHQHAESTHSGLHAAIPGRTVIGPVVQVHTIQFLGTHGIEIQIPSTTEPKANLLGSDLPREESELLLENLLQKKVKAICNPHRGNSCE